MLKRLASLVLLAFASFALAQESSPWSKDVSEVRKHFVKAENALLGGDTRVAEREFAKAFQEASAIQQKTPDEPELAEFVRRLQAMFENLQRMHNLAIIASPPEKAESSTVAHALPQVDLYAYPIQIAPALADRISENLRSTRYDFPVVLNEDVLRAMEFFLKNRHGRRLMQTGLERIGLYEEYIREAFRSEGLPADLIYLAQLESNFFPNAVSRADAVGLWQFVADTGMRHGLKIDWWVDQRVDPYKSTQAAARYLKSLHDRFGDWYLVLASYNTGEGRIIPLADKGLRDFWEISRQKLIARETRDFVPLILAIAIIAKNPGEFGFEIQATEPLRFDTVEIKRPVSLSAIAKRFKVDLNDLRELNPELRQDITPQYLESYTLRLPFGTTGQAAGNASAQ